jgi:cytochrome c-type biogenesis protein CcmE
VQSALPVGLTRTEPLIMKENGKFFAGLGGVALVATYLVWTGVSETMLYYLTPVELIARVAEDPSFHQVGVKVSGRVVNGSWSRAEEELLHHFTVVDLEDESVTFAVEYRDKLPDTFNDTEIVDVVVEGRYREDGVFEATVVLAKCGSRYEATQEELLG